MSEDFKKVFNVFVKNYHQWALMVKDRPGSPLPASEPEVIKGGDKNLGDIVAQKKLGALFYNMVLEASKAGVLTEENGKELYKYFGKEFA